MKQLTWILLLVVVVYGCTQTTVVDDHEVDDQEETEEGLNEDEEIHEEELQAEMEESEVMEEDPVEESQDAIEETEEVTVEEEAMEETVKEFNIRAFRFDFDPNEITVKKGDKVKINIENTDTTHGIFLPEFGVSGNEVVEFTADKAGTFSWNCNTFCGGGHSGMKGTLIVTE